MTGVVIGQLLELWCTELRQVEAQGLVRPVGRLFGLAV